MSQPLQSPVIAGGLVALGLALAGLLVGNGIARIKSGDAVVSVRGVAERNVTADLATWTIATQAAGSDLASVQAKADADAAAVRAFLKANGFAGDEVSNRGISVSQYMDSNSGRLNITIRQRLQVRTTRINDMVKAFANQAEIIRQGVALDSDGGGGLTYSFTKLNEVKPAMIAEATKSARAAAEQFAKDSETAVGGIRTATQGLFSIEARDGETGSGSDTPNQKVRVVTTIEFYLDE
ncbi:SIMPL domain-containing protein [Sandaracinobacteroides saxicola]|uniref:SIMPL domain-containing protein n=1 Tax=Sandaracinobacteroides saxicola TaxID=2759707 RepID=A0A7G5IHG2_9SPHN|nr:SIMPL domain-containing protein [Sandaracinobacteroides saxicola]QMW22804.1 SIMPL domain-containing protein [Sandaracinobacteroides saxicola]